MCERLVIKTQISFEDRGKNSSVCLDDVCRIKIMDNAIRLYTLDGFTTVIECPKDIVLSGVKMK